MRARRLDNGNLLVPMRAEGPGGVLGDGRVEIRPEHPDYGRWLPHIEETDTHPVERPSGRRGGSDPEAR